MKCVAHLIEVAALVFVRANRATFGVLNLKISFMNTHNHIGNSVVILSKASVPPTVPVIRARWTLAERQRRRKAVCYVRRRNGFIEYKYPTLIVTIYAGDADIACQCNNHRAIRPLWCSGAAVRRAAIQRHSRLKRDVAKRGNPLSITCLGRLAQCVLLDMR